MEDDDLMFDERESIIIALLYLESEIRQSRMNLTGDQIKKTIFTAIEEIDETTHPLKDMKVIKRCLEKAYQQNNEKIIEMLEQLKLLKDTEKSNKKKPPKSKTVN